MEGGGWRNWNMQGISTAPGKGDGKVSIEEMDDKVIETFKVVVAIDVGTTYSGYAFSFKHDYDIDPMKIQVPQSFVAGESNHLSHKTSTSLLLDKNRKFISFGFDAESKYANAEHPEELYFFHRFKMSLYKTKDISSDLKIKDITGKKLVPALDVFSLSIKALKDDFLDKMKSKNLQDALIEERILWVITVPAIWPQNAKTFMIECAEKAGLKEQQITIALEPEAGAICCQQKYELNLAETGCTYLVADLGGGTADLTVHEKLADGSLKELHKADGVDSGGTNVDKKFLEFFSELTQTPNIQSILSAESRFDLLRSIEILKRRVKHDSDDDIVFEVPDLFTEDERDIKENIKELIERYCAENGSDIIKARKGRKLSIKASHLKSFFKETIDKIIQRIKKVLEETKSAKPVDIILLVGGFSESTIVVETVRTFFSNKNVMSPNEAGLAILQGAVIYGYDNEIIYSRILTHSYGQSICREFDVARDEGRETITKGSEVYCVGVFNEIAAAGEEVKRGDKKIVIVETLFDFQPGINVKFYACPDKTPEYIDDPDCTEIGSLFVPLLLPLPAGRPIIIVVQFGGTVIRVTAMDGLLPLPCRTTLKLKD